MKKISTVSCRMRLGAAVALVASLWATTASATNTNAPGTLAGAFQVSPGGAAGYSMPLELPPGAGGITPQLAVVYNSSGSDTYVAPGVGISGFSQITRCPSNLRDDGARYGTTFTATDRFCLDGQRLVPSSGTSYGAVGAVYHTQIESFSQVTSVGGSAGVPDHWVVKTKSGLTMTYGQQYRFTVKGNTSKTLIWLLERTQDIVGNYMDFTYTLPTSSNGYDGAYFPSQIKYGGNLTQGTPADIVVTFDYQMPAGFWPSGYMNGQIIDWNQQLLDIKVSNVDDSSGKYPTWKFVYTTPTGVTANTPGTRPLLQSVQKCAGSSCSAPTQFGFVPATGTESVNTISGLALGDTTGTVFQKFSGDFDGDGKADVIGIVVASNGTGRGYVWRGGYPNSAPITWAISGLTAPGSAVVADINGDGLSDITYLSVSAGSVKVTTWYGNAAGAAPASSGSITAGSMSTNQDGTPTLLVGDFNGDGRDDLYACYHWTVGTAAGKTFFTYGQLLTNSSGTISAGSPYLLASTVGQLTVRGIGGFPLCSAADMNGDGTTDVAVTYQNANAINNVNFTIYYGGQAAGATTQTLQTKGIPASALAQIVDVNADGSADLLLTQQTGNVGSVATFFNDGTGSFNFPSTATTVPWQNASLPSTDHYTPFFGDLDGDGYVDIAWVSGQQLLPLFSCGAKGFIAGAAISAGNSIGGSITPVVADSDGNGASEILLWGTTNNDSTASLAITSFQLVGHPLLSSIANGLGASVAISYLPLTDITATDSSGVYVAPTAGSQTFPIKPFVGPAYVVSKTTISNAGNSGRVTQYRYYGGRFDVQGRGFLGFSQVDSTDITNSTFGTTTVPPIKDTVTYSQQFPSIGLELSHQTVDTTNGTSLLIASTTTTYQSKSPVAAPLATIVYPSTSIARNYEIAGGTAVLVTTTQTTNGYGDDYGNLTSNTITTYAGDVGGTPSHGTQTTNTYDAADATNWILGRLNKTVVTHSATNAANIVRTSGFGYDATTHLLAYEIIEPNDTGHLYLRTDYGRDGFGNITSTTVSGKDITTRASTATFSTSSPTFGRFKTQACNALQQCHTYTYAAATGNVLTDVDPNGVTVMNSYDDFGRTSVINLIQIGLQVQTNITRDWCVNQPTYCNSAGTGVYFELTTKTDFSQHVTVYDSSERVVRKASQVYDGSGVNWIESLTAYDAAGRVAQTSNSRFANAASSSTFWTTTAYDHLNRPQTVTAPTDQNHPTGSITSYAYSGLTTTVTNPRGKKTTTVMTVTGKAASVTDANSASVTYAYDAEDNLTSTKDSGSHTTTIQYDIRGRKTQIVDLDMGTWKYTPDSLGEVLNQTDAKANVLKMTYDALGRMKTRISPEDSTTWVYDTLYKGALTSVTTTKTVGGTRYSRSFTYTKFGAPITDTTVIESNSYVMTYTYDSQGRVSKTTYPQGFATTTSYSSYSGAEALICVPGSCSGNNAQYYWIAGSWDEWGQPYLEMAGNKVQTMTNRDLAVGKVNVMSIGSGGAIDDFNYTWDANGNLTQRGNYAVGGVTENFTYDAVDRMTSAATVSGSTTSVGYDNFGNITSKTGVGTYTYGSTRPHAVTAIGSNNYSYDTNGNLLSGGGRSYTWSSYNMPLTLSNASGSSTFEYGPNNEKIRQVVQPNSGAATTTDYVGGGLFEAIYSGSTTTYKNYIVAPTGTVAIETQSSTQSDSVMYLHHDNLGSVVAITNATGGVVQKLSYDAFGNSSITQTGSGLSGNQSTLGYTEHVELYNLGLVHMNGRVYDPILGRFLSPDPNVQSPDNLQSYNRYSYVWNNPLTYTDPSGFFLSGLGHFWSHNWRTFAAISVEVAAVYFGPEAFPLLSQTDIAVAGGFAAGEIQSNGSLQGGVVGGLAAGSFATIGGGFNENPANLSSTEVGAKIALHGLVGGFASVAQGGSFGSGFLSAALPESVALGTGDYGRFGDSPWSSGEKIVTAAAIGGTASVIGGGKFANGAITGAFSEAYNESLSHVTTIEVDRFLQTDTSTIGRLTVDGTNIRGYTLEPPGADSTAEGSDQRIPAGTYSVVPHSSDAHPDSYEVQGVDGRTVILIHSGNYPGDTQGCILPGESYSPNAVWQSQAMVQKIYSELKGSSSAQIIIRNKFDASQNH